MKLNPSSSASLRSVNLLDFDEEGANIDPIVPVGAAGTGANPVPSKVDARVAVVSAATSSAQPSEVPGGSGEKTDAACWCPDPGVRIPTSKCCVFPRPR